jgi:hypothetical protein
MMSDADALWLDRKLVINAPILIKGQAHLKAGYSLGQRLQRSSGGF